MRAVEEFLFEFQTTGMKLAGALGCVARGGYMPQRAFTVAYLKRALDHCTNPRLVWKLSLQGSFCLQILWRRLERSCSRSVRAF
jgi:hypothetical protein